MARRDIRLAVDLDQNPKVRRLMRELGGAAAWSLVRLWCYTARHRPSGVLAGIGRDEIEGILGWRGRRSALVGAFETLGFLERNGNGDLIVHDWEEHQPWVAGQEARSEAARQAARAKWAKAGKLREKAKDEDAKRHADCHAGSHADGDAPSPSPSPSPKPSLGGNGGNGADGSGATAPAALLPEDVQTQLSRMKHDVLSKTLGEYHAGNRNKASVVDQLRTANFTGVEMDLVYPLLEEGGNG